MSISTHLSSGRANAQLHTPTTLNPKLDVQGTPYTVTQPTTLDNLIQPNVGACDWAACTYMPSSPAANLMYDTKGVFDTATKSFTKLYTTK